MSIKLMITITEADSGVIGFLSLPIIKMVENIPNENKPIKMYFIYL